MTEKLRVLITGATSGIGRELAVQLGRRGARVALAGRRKERLDTAAAAVREGGGEPLALHSDVTDRESVKAAYADIRGQWGGLDWAILNAGVGDSSGALEFSAENYRWTFDTNVQGVANWIEAVLPDMLSARSGTIAGVASIAGYRGLPKSGAYCASKSALITMLESTRVDLVGTGVRVVTICPGFVKSEMTDRNSPKEMLFLLETEDGARRILRGIERGDRVVHFPWQLSCLMIYFVHNLPGWFYDRVIQVFKKRKKRPTIDESKRSSP